MQWWPFLARSFKRETAAFACSVAVASVVSHDFPVEASTEDDFDKTFANLVELKVDALVFSQMCSLLRETSNLER
jgi:hypothetical protein